MAPNDNFISRGIQSGVATAGSFAGGIVDSAGKTVQNGGRGVGNSVANTTNTWGNSARDYGNGVKDATKASGTRSQTAQNPLGMGRNAVSGRQTVAGGGGGKAGGKGSAGNPLGLGK